MRCPSILVSLGSTLWSASDVLGGCHCYRVCVRAGTAMPWVQTQSRADSFLIEDLVTSVRHQVECWNKCLLCSISSLKTYHFRRTNLSPCEHAIDSSNCFNSWDFKQMCYLKFLFFRDLLVHDSIVPKCDSHDHLSLTIPFHQMLPQKETPAIPK